MYGYDTSNEMTRDPNLRASDTEREATADRLRHHHSEGRLDSDEFQERLDRCFAAKTVGELADVMRDLPPDGPRRDSLGHTRRPGLLWVGPIVAIVLAIAALHLIIGVTRGPWFLIPLFLLARFTIFRRGCRPWSSRRGPAL